MRITFLIFASLAIAPCASASIPETSLAKVPFDSAIWSYQSSAPLVNGKIGIFARRGTDAIATLVEDHSTPDLIPDVREEVYCKQLARSFHETDLAVCRKPMKLLRPTLKTGPILVGVSAHEREGENAAGVWVLQFAFPPKSSAAQKKKLEHDFETLLAAFKRAGGNGK